MRIVSPFVSIYSNDNKNKEKKPRLKFLPNLIEGCQMANDIKPAQRLKCIKAEKKLSIGFIDMLIKCTVQVSFIVNRHFILLKNRKKRERKKTKL